MRATAHFYSSSTSTCSLISASGPKAILLFVWVSSQAPACRQVMHLRTFSCLPQLFLSLFYVHIQAKSTIELRENILMFKVQGLKMKMWLKLHFSVPFCKLMHFFGTTLHIGVTFLNVKLKEDDKSILFLSKPT